MIVVWWDTVGLFLVVGGVTFDCWVCRCLGLFALGVVCDLVVITVSCWVAWWFGLLRFSCCDGWFRLLFLWGGLVIVCPAWAFGLWIAAAFQLACDEFCRLVVYVIACDFCGCFGMYLFVWFMLLIIWCFMIVWFGDLVASAF